MRPKQYISDALMADNHIWLSSRDLKTTSTPCFEIPDGGGEKRKSCLRTGEIWRAKCAQHAGQNTERSKKRTKKLRRRGTRTWSRPSPPTYP